MTGGELVGYAHAAVVESSPLAVVASDEEQRLVLWSPAAERLFGWKSDEVLGRRMDEVGMIPAEQCEQFRQLHRDVVCGRRAHSSTVVRTSLPGAGLHLRVEGWAASILGL